MIYIYEVSNRRLVIYDQDNVKEIELTKLESKILDVLCNGQFNTYEMMVEYVYGARFKSLDDALCSNLRKIKSELLKKVKLNVKNIYKLGYMLEDEILIK